MSEIAYHLGELEIARNVDDARHILPELPEAFESRRLTCETTACLRAALRQCPNKREAR
ncbi:MAG TPA: hypothetical protein VKG02_21470 [Blastocatellia bacterium]|nr:hypothetical protein [Blastocatellia bacterium]